MASGRVGPSTVLRLIAGGIWLTLFCGISATSWSQEVPGCGVLQNAFGPFDYRDPVARGEPLHLVDIGHFTAATEALDPRGVTGILIGDLDYTLRAFPNHHRALIAVGRYALRGRVRWINPNVQSAECYYERAMAFASDDEVVRAIYANYLSKSGKRK